MKKFLAILVLGFLVCGLAQAASLLPECKGSNSKKWTNCQGTLTTTGSDGIKYVGEFKDGEPHGQGTLTSVVGNKFVGEWKAGKLEGQGTAISPAGEYVGEFKNYLPDGQGTYIYANGDKYIGKWKDGLWHGLGTVTGTDGKFLKGIFKKGEMVKIHEMQ